MLAPTRRAVDGGAGGAGRRPSGRGRVSTAAFERRWREVHAASRRRPRSGDLAATGRFAMCRFPRGPRDAAPQLYYLFYRSPAPFDAYTVHDYVVTPIDGTMPEDVQAAPPGGVEPQHHHAQPCRASRRRSDITCRTGTRPRVDVAHRHRRGGRCRQPHRHVPGRLDGRGLGLLCQRPGGGARAPHAARAGVGAAHPRPPAGARHRGSSAAPGRLGLR